MDKRDYYVKKTYGLSPETYKQMVAYSKNKCYICRKEPAHGKHLNIDHDHKTGEVRGLLCFFCNKYLIGRRRREHAYLFTAAAKYLTAQHHWGVVPPRVKKRKK